jgi:hypothetical protein
MVIPIDAVRYGAGLDAFGHWHETEAEYRLTDAEEAERDMMSPARGAICGLLLSGLLWMGLAVVVRGVLTLVR